jgi:hypothetical protein
MASENEARRLAAAISIRTLEAWNTVFIFRTMAQLGLPHANPQLAEQHCQTVRALADAEIFDVAERGKLGRIVDRVSMHSVEIFESALDAASLIFAHSVLDSVAGDACRVCALAEPDGFMSHIKNKQFALREIQDGPKVRYSRGPPANNPARICHSDAIANLGQP